MISWQVATKIRAIGYFGAPTFQVLSPGKASLLQASSMKTKFSFHSNHSVLSKEI